MTSSSPPSSPPAPPAAPPAGGRRERASQPLRLVEHTPPSAHAALEPHPLTTLATPLLPPRDAAGARADVWEELDHAAAWVCAHWAADRSTADACAGGRREEGGSYARNDLRQALRVLCVAARSAELAAAASGGGSVPALRPGDLPWNVPVPALVRALRQRLVAQTVAAATAGEPAADPTAVLRVIGALDRLDDVARTDTTRTVVDQLTGATALDLLVEVAHDMRSPLGSILFLVERVRRVHGAHGAPLTDAQDRQLALVHGAAFGLSAMVGDVMELARGGDRLATGEPAPVSLVDVFDAVCAIAQPLAEEKRLTFTAGVVPSERRLGHAAAIQRVLLNLVTNALKYTPEGTVSIWAEACGQTRVAFTIEDTGRGIPANVLANLFQTFRQRASRDYAFSSAGLGLAICQKLIAAMGGELEVDSQEGRGTRFMFELELPVVNY